MKRTVSITAMLTGVVLLESVALAETPVIQRFIEGRDAQAVVMDALDAAVELNDPWGAGVLRAGTFPEHLDAALAAATALGASAQECFFVSESGQLPVNLTLDRSFRMVITRAKAGLPQRILMSAPAGPREGFIELMAWDDTKKAWNFYRRSTGREWVWKGDTRDAFSASAQGKGCFACHSHGVPVMKELRGPWSNWHSMSAAIPAEAIPTKAIRTSPLFVNKSQAEALEKVVRAGVLEGVTAHVARVKVSPDAVAARGVLQALFRPRTLNLASSDDRAAPVVPRPTLTLPPRAFLNAEALALCGVTVPTTLDTEIQRTHYHAALTQFNVRLDDGTGFTRAGDTHFAFVVPEPALEEFELINAAIDQQLMTKHFALSVLSIDFVNPWHSPERAALEKYIATTGTAAQVAERTTQAIVMAAPSTPAGSPERLFAANFAKTPRQLQQDSSQGVAQFTTALTARLRTAEGVADMLRLATAMRRRFEPHPLNESPLLLPKTDIPATSNWRMTPAATLAPIP